MWFFIDSCCSTLKISATGSAKTEQWDRLGEFIYHKLGPNGKKVFKQTPEILSESYLFISPNNIWVVWNIDCRISSYMRFKKSSKLQYLNTQIILVTFRSGKITHQIQLDYKIHRVTKTAPQDVQINGNTMKIQFGN